MNPWLDDGDVKLYHGHVLDVLDNLPEASAQTCVTSPPYWGLRDYGADGQIGLEATPDEYVATMVSVFAGVRRVLRDDGTLWLNLGDSYASTPPGAGGAGSTSGLNGISSKGYRDRLDASRGRKANTVVAGLKPKDLVGIPWRVAFALQADGWYLRSAIVWAKPNPMPESVTDRPTSAYEMVFLLAKSARYYYDADAIREDGPGDHPRRNVPQEYAAPGQSAQMKKRVKVPGGWDRGDGGHGTIHRDGRTSAEYQDATVKAGRNARNVWTIPTQPFPDAHFATYPEELPRRCILAGSRERDTVLDPFIGSGTTAKVARDHNRNAIGIDLNADYLAIAARRLRQLSLLAEATQ